MAPLTHHHPTTLSEAIALLARPHHVPWGGGTDVPDLIARGVLRATALVHLGAIPELRGLEPDGTGVLRVGAAERLVDLANHLLLGERYALLATACAHAGTLATGEAATLGGSLARRPTCPVFRRNEPCLKNGGSACLAHDLESETLAILEGGPCWSSHASHPGVALVALDAMIDIAGPLGARSVAASSFFVLPSQRIDREIALTDGELIIAVRLPAEAAGGLQQFVTRSKRGSDDVDVALAIARRLDGDVRLVLGGVSPRPYRVYGSVEEEAMSGGLDDDTIAGLAERALLDAVPLSQNAGKLDRAMSLLREAIVTVSNTIAG